MNKIIPLAILLLLSFNSFAQQQNDEKAISGYLFAYFEGSGDNQLQEQLRFANSSNGTDWFALNGNKPVLKSADISKTGGIRDPHLLRANDGENFYLTATDMFTVKNGWEHNSGIILLKSTNLTDWTHAKVDLATLYPKKFANVKWVWAPQTIYDAKAGKYLIYFTIRFKGDEKLNFYSAYANKDFTGFEQEPKLMFAPKDGAIDGDIIYKDGVYHFFFKGNTKEGGKEVKNGIKKATSKSLKGPWVESFDYLDVYAGTQTAVEGSSIFKLNNSDDYILMYDLYKNGKYEFQRSKDLNTFTKKTESFAKDFNPRHGSVIGISREEARRLNNKWGGVRETMLQPVLAGERHEFKATGNPIIKHSYTADPAALVEDGKVWLFAGHDFAGGQKNYKMKDWLVYSTPDLTNWTEYPVPMKITDFSWAKSGDAFAGHVAKKDGKYYWYISTNWSGIGVGVADKPEGPYKDALGKPLLTNKDCFASTHSWACIDPAVYTDEKGDSWIFWGNRECYYAKLKPNMIEIDGEVKQVKFDGFDFTEAPWIHKRNDWYYLTYASGFPEKLAYAMSKNITGPWEYKGLLNEIAGNSNTNHQAIIDFKGKSYFIYHNGALQTDGSSYSRSIAIEELFYNADGTIKKIVMTTEGVNGK